MNEIDLLDRLGDDTPPASADVLAAARARVMTEAAPQASTQRTAPPRARRSSRRVLVGVAAAATLVAGALVAQTVGGSSTLPAASAAQVLERAADATTDPVVRPGQYLKVSSTGTRRRAFDDVVWQETARTEVWIPHDPAGMWVKRDSSGAPYVFASPADEKRARDYGALDARPKLIRAPGGRFDDLPSDDALWERRAAYFRDLPRDPDALLRRAYDRSDIPQRSQEFSERFQHDLAFYRLLNVLRSPASPADVRATALRAAARIPGTSLAQEPVSIAGRTGTAVVRIDGIFGDQGTLVIGERSGQLEAVQTLAVKDGPWGPAGTVTATVAFTRTVVDASDVPVAE